MLAAATATLVDPDTIPIIVTCLPIRVYVPDELNVPITVKPPPWLGVQVPSSYQFSKVLVLPAAGVLAEKSMPLPDVPMTRLPVLNVASPTNVGVVMLGLVENTKFVVVVPVAPEAE